MIVISSERAYATSY